MLRNCLPGIVFVIGLVALAPERAQAQYSVYKFNHKRPKEGWVRVGDTGGVNKSVKACQANINIRVKENKFYRQDFESFGYHPGTAKNLKGKPSTIRYVAPGYRVQLDRPRGLDPTRMLAGAWRDDRVDGSTAVHPGERAVARFTDVPSVRMDV